MLRRKIGWHLMLPVIGLLLLSGKVNAQVEGLWELLPAEGVNFPDVNTWYQDKRGVLWIGTSLGLYRYTGTEIVTYNDFSKNPHYIPSNFIHKIVGLDDDHLLIVGSKKLFRLNTITDKVNFLLPNGEISQSNKINGVLKNKDGQIYLDYKNDKHNYLLKWLGGNKTEVVDSIKISSGRQVALIASTNGDIFWSTSLGGVFHYDSYGNRKKQIKVDSVLFNGKFNFSMGLGFDRLRQGIWILPHFSKSQGTKAFFYDLNTQKIKVDPLNFPSITNHTFADSQGKMWFFHDNVENAFRLNPDNSITNLENELPNASGSKIVKSIYEDSQNTIWVNVANKIFKRSNKKSPFLKIAYSNNKKNPKTPWTFFEDKEGLVYFKMKTPQTDIFRINPNNYEIDPIILKQKDGTPVKLHQNNRQYFYDAPQNIVWGLHTPNAEKEKGLATIDLSNQQFFLYDTSIYSKLLPIRSRSLTRLPDGNLLIGGSIKKLIEYNPKTRKYKKVVSDSLLSNDYNDIFNLNIGENGSIYALMYNRGLFRISPNRDYIEHYSTTSQPALSNNYVFCMHEAEADSILWVGTAYGLNKINLQTKDIQYFTRENGLCSNIINGILPYGKDYLIISTNHGLSLFNTKTADFRNFYEQQGITANQFQHYSFFIDKQGLYYFGSINGITAFYPSDLLNSNKVEKPLITRLQVYNSQTDSIRIHTKNFGDNFSFTLLPSDVYFQLHFALPSFLSPEKHQFQTWLEGYEKNWSPQGTTTTIRYNSLPAGSYTLHIKGADSQGNWSEVQAIPITVQEYWYKKNWALCSYALLGVLGIYFLFNNRLKRQIEREETKRVMELDAIKTRFYTNITHEFRTPLTVISGMTELIKTNPYYWLNRGIEMVQRNTSQLLQLVNQLLDLQKIAVGQLTLNTQPYELVSFLKYTLSSFQDYAHSQQLNLHFSSEEESIIAEFDKDKLQMIISNLLSNSIKFTPKEGRIFLELKKVDNQVSIKVSDTGIGIAPSDLKAVFDRFHQLDNSMTREGEGTGIGLSLVKELTELMGGTIKLTSQLEKGTKVVLSLPIISKIKTPIPFKAPSFVQADFPTNIPVALNENELKRGELNEKVELLPHLLIIEDNLDVVIYLQSLLHGVYQVSVAKNGLEGLEKAKAFIPDLIISDVMMPKMDGFQLCYRLKRDTLTSHIPTILLTAKVTQEDKMEGLRQGADAYLQKPFYSQELLLRVEKMLELRKALREKYRDSSFDEIATKTPDIEQQFLLSIREKVLANLDDPTFKPDQLAKALLISRSQLHRKIKALTGQSTSLYTRSIRLQASKKMLLETKLNISEIAYSTGFNTPQYFTKCFVATFQETPFEYRKSKEKSQ